MSQNKSSEVIDKKLAAPVRFRRVRDKEIRVSLPDVGYIEADIAKEDKELHIREFEVREDKRNLGVGRRLLKSLAVIAKDEGIEKITGDVIDPTALSLRQKVYGDDGLHIYDADRRPLQELPITIDKAIESIQRADKAYDEHPNPNFGTDFYVVSDITDLDVTDWERPAEK